MMECLSAQALGRLADQLRQYSTAELLAISREAGVRPREARCVLQRRKLGASSFLLLCSALGIDPTTARCRPLCRDGFFSSFSHFAVALQFARARDKLPLRAAAPAMGVSTATLSRAEAGRPIAVESLLRICGHVGFAPEAFLVFTGNNNCNTAPSHRKSNACSLCGVGRAADQGG